MSAAAAPAITKHQLETNLIEKCWKDPEFRSAVLKDPKGMLESFLGKSLPPDFKIMIHEEDAKTMHFALPPTPSSVSELSDEELQKVAGGTELVAATIIAAVGTILGVGMIAGVSKGGWA